MTGTISLSREGSLFIAFDMDWMFVSPPNSNIEILSPNVMVLEDETLGG